MKIGLTYDLQSEYLAEGFSQEETAEFDKEITIDTLAETISSFGFETIKIGNIKALVQRLANGEKWDLVFNICEGMYGLSREAQVPALLEAYQIPCVFSDPLVLGISLDKGLSKRIVQDLGLPTPDFYIVAKEQDIAQCQLAYPVFAKPIAEGTSKGITADSKVHSYEELEKVCLSLLSTYNQPVLVEKYLPGREFTVGITGTAEHAEVIGVMEISLLKSPEAESYTFLNKQEWEGKVDYTKAEGPLAQECAKLALDAWKGLNCRDGGRIDIRLDEDGKPNFLEVNTLPGLNPEISDLSILARMNGIDYTQLIKRILFSALHRLKKGPYQAN